MSLKLPNVFSSSHPILDLVAGYKSMMHYPNSRQQDEMSDSEVIQLETLRAIDSGKPYCLLGMESFHRSRVDRLTTARAKAVEVL